MKTLCISIGLFSLLILAGCGQSSQGPVMVDLGNPSAGDDARGVLRSDYRRHYCDEMPREMRDEIQITIDKAVVLAARPNLLAVAGEESVRFRFKDSSSNDIGPFRFALMSRYGISGQPGSVENVMTAVRSQPFRVAFVHLLMGGGGSEWAGEVGNLVASFSASSGDDLPAPESLVKQFANGGSPQQIVSDYQAQLTQQAYVKLRLISTNPWQHQLPDTQMLALFRSMLADVSPSAAATGGTAWLGIDVADCPQGAYVVAVHDFPTVRPVGVGNVITAIDGAPIRTANDLTQTIAHHQPGDHVAISWLANPLSSDAPVSGDVILAPQPESSQQTSSPAASFADAVPPPQPTSPVAMPPASPAPNPGGGWLGIQVAQGEVAPVAMAAFQGSPALGRLMRGDQIIAGLDSTGLLHTFHTVADLSAFTSGHAPGESVTLVIHRAFTQLRVSLTLEARPSP